MPELCEVEQYRELATAVVGRVICAVDLPDDRYVARPVTGAGLRQALVGTTVTSVGRQGKVLLVNCAGARGRHTLGLRFGMTGRLLVDGAAAIDRLVYGPVRDERSWDRFILGFDSGELRLRDPRRLGRVELDPDVGRLGPDVLDIDATIVAARLGSTARPVKAVLLDQSVLAGLGNLLTDETLYRCGIDPRRAVADLTAEERGRLAAAIPATVRDLLERGGSHRGDLQGARRPGGTCPRDGAPLRRAEVGGRTTYWCPDHQA